MPEDKIVDLPVADTLRPDQALAEAMKCADGFENIMIIGIHEGDHYCVHSSMDLERALFILETEKGRVMANATARALVAETPFGDFINDA